MPNLNEALDKLAALSRLPEGWDYGRGGPASPAALASGRNLLFRISSLGVDSYDVVPGDQDGPVIIAYRNDCSAEVYCKSNMKYDLLYENSCQEEELFGNLSLTQLLFKLGEFGWRSPRFYGSCIRNVMLRESGDTAVLHSGIPLGAVYPSSRQTVSPQEMWSHALTLENFTAPIPAGNRLSSGAYKLVRSQKALA